MHVLSMSMPPHPDQQISILDNQQLQCTCHSSRKKVSDRLSQVETSKLVLPPVRKFRANKRSSARHLRVRCPLHFVLAVCQLLPFFEETYSLRLFFCIYFSVKIETVQRNYTSATRIFQDFLFSWQDLSPNVHSVMCMGEVRQDRIG